MKTDRATSYRTTLLAAALLTAGVAAQPGRLTKSEIGDVRELVAAADRAMKGEVAASDAAWLRWQPHFLRAPDGRTYVPFTLAIEDVPDYAFTSVAMYIRVAKRGDRKTSPERDRRIGPTGSDVPVFAYDDAAAASAALRLLDRPEQTRTGPYPFEAAHFTPVWWSDRMGILQRAIAVPPGSYDLYIAIRESEASLPRGGLARSGVFRHALDVPDFSVKGLAMSTPILAERVNPIKRPLEPEEQMARPYAMGTVEIVPAVGRTFTASDTLTAVFFVYNARMDRRGKPDVTAEYRFHRMDEDGTEGLLDRPLTQRLNAESLPAEFDLRVGHQIVPMQSVPLASFEAGRYRLEIRITDHVAPATVSRDVRFAVR